MKRGLLIAQFSLEPGSEAEFDEGYQKHMRDSMELPGFVAGKRYRRVDSGNAPWVPGGDPLPAHLTCYVLESDDLLETWHSAATAVADGRMPPSTTKATMADLRMSLYEESYSIERP